MNLKEYLDSINESPRAFAKRTCISQSTIYKVLRGGKVRIDTAKLICKRTKRNVTMKDLGHTLKVYMFPPNAKKEGSEDVPTCLGDFLGPLPNHSD